MESWELEPQLRWQLCSGTWAHGLLLPSQCWKQPCQKLRHGLPVPLPQASPRFDSAPLCAASQPPARSPGRGCWLCCKRRRQPCGQGHFTGQRCFTR